MEETKITNFPKKILKGLCMHDTHTERKGGGFRQIWDTGGSKKKNSFSREINRTCLWARVWKVSRSSSP